MQVKAYPRIYQFGPLFKTLLILAGIALIGLGLWGEIKSYETLPDVGHQFFGILVSLLPMALALIGIPMLWQCKLSLYEDHLEYHGLLVHRVIRKADVQLALRPEPRYGMFSVILTLYGQPLKSIHIAVLGRMDDVFAGWVSALPNPKGSEPSLH